MKTIILGVLVVIVGILGIAVGYGWGYHHGIDQARVDQSSLIANTVMNVDKRQPMPLNQNPIMPDRQQAIDDQRVAVKEGILDAMKKTAQAWAESGDDPAFKAAMADVPLRELTPAESVTMKNGSPEEKGKLQAELLKDQKIRRQAIFWAGEKKKYPNVKIDPPTLKDCHGNQEDYEIDLEAWKRVFGEQAMAGN